MLFFGMASGGGSEGDNPSATATSALETDEQLQYVPLKGWFATSAASFC